MTELMPLTSCAAKMYLGFCMHPDATATGMRLYHQLQDAIKSLGFRVSKTGSDCLKTRSEYTYNYK